MNRQTTLKKKEEEEEEEAVFNAKMISQLTDKLMDRKVINNIFIVL